MGDTKWGVFYNTYCDWGMCRILERESKSDKGQRHITWEVKFQTNFKGRVWGKESSKERLTCVKPKELERA